MRKFEFHLRVFSLGRFLGGFIAFLREMFSYRRRLITEDVMHHLDVLPLAVSKLNEFVFADLSGEKSVNFGDFEKFFFSPQQCDKSAKHDAIDPSTSRELFHP
jgi:hypothetical protein